MLTVKQLIAGSKSHRPILVENSNIVSVQFYATYVGEDKFGYFKAIPGGAITNEKGKKKHDFEIRLYWEKKSGYVPQRFRPKQKLVKSGKSIEAYGGPDEPPPFTLNTKCWVSCDCAYFLFHCEVADAWKNSSTLKYSNGKAPNITNPNGIPHLCKHVIKSLRAGALLRK